MTVVMNFILVFLHFIALRAAWAQLQFCDSTWCYNKFNITTTLQEADSICRLFTPNASRPDSHAWLYGADLSSDSYLKFQFALAYLDINQTWLNVIGKYHDWNYVYNSQSPPFRDQGCFKDGTDRDRDLNGNLTIFPTVNYVYYGPMPSKCWAKCASEPAHFLYAGSQSGRYCYCGPTYGRFGRSNQCLEPCLNNTNQLCGGYYRNSIYYLGSDAVVGAWQTGYPADNGDCAYWAGDTNYASWKDAVCAEKKLYMCRGNRFQLDSRFWSAVNVLSNKDVFGYSTVPLSWADARADCRAKGGDLMWFLDDSEINTVRTALQQLLGGLMSPIWIGATNIAWTDGASGNSVQQTYWARDEPQSRLIPKAPVCVQAIRQAGNGAVFQWETKSCTEQPSQFVCVSSASTTTSSAATSSPTLPSTVTTATSSSASTVPVSSSATQPSATSTASLRTNLPTGTSLSPTSVVTGAATGSQSMTSSQTTIVATTAPSNQTPPVTPSVTTATTLADNTSVASALSSTPFFPFTTSDNSASNLQSSAASQNSDNSVRVAESQLISDTQKKILIGCGVGILGILVLGIVVVVCCMARRRRAKKSAAAAHISAYGDYPYGVAARDNAAFKVEDDESGPQPPVRSTSLDPHSQGVYDLHPPGSVLFQPKTDRAHTAKPSHLTTTASGSPSPPSTRSDLKNPDSDSGLSATAF